MHSIVQATNNKSNFLFITFLSWTMFFLSWLAWRHRLDKIDRVMLMSWELINLILIEDTIEKQWATAPKSLDIVLDDLFGDLIKELQDSSSLVCDWGQVEWVWVNRVETLKWMLTLLNLHHVHLGHQFIFD